MFTNRTPPQRLKNVFTVAASGGDAATITAGVSLASSGDTVEVYAGTYTEDVTVSAGVLLKGMGGVTVDGDIDLGDTGQVEGIELTAGHYFKRNGFPIGLIAVTDRFELDTAPGTYARVEDENGDPGQNWPSFAGRHKHTITQACKELVLVFGTNSDCTNKLTGAQTILNAVEIRGASVEVSGEATPLVLPITFGGQRSVTMAVGEIVMSDPLPINLKAGDVIYTRTAMAVPTEGNQIPVIAPRTGDKSSYWSGADWDLDTDLTLIDGVLAGDRWQFGASFWACGPAYVLGTPIADHKPMVVLIGDSILTKQEYDYHTWITRYLTDHNIPFVCLAKGSEHATVVATQWQSMLDNDVLCWPMLDQADIIISALLRNDVAATGLNTVAAFQTRAQAYWDRLHARCPNAKILQVTIAPWTNAANSADGGTDNWALGTPTTGLMAINNWIRTCPAPLAGVIDFADLAMSGRNTNRWKTNYSKDGIHPELQATAVVGTYVGILGIQGEIEDSAADYGQLLGVDTAAVASIRVSAEATNVVTTTIQLRNEDGTHPRGGVARVWLSDTAGGDVVATAPDGGLEVTTGTQTTEVTAGKELVITADATGLIVMTALHEAGAKTAYANVEFMGRVCTSSKMTWAA